MAGELLIKAEGLSKKFARDLRTSFRYGVVDLSNELIGRPRSAVLRPHEFWAVDGLDFKLHRGECLGLIGHNGAGKTTLLRMLNGLVKPDRGRVEIRGRVGALIALGAGFDPILTGRENIYVNAAVLGMGRRQVEQRIDEIIEFAEIGDFIDTPVQHYSSGMSVRLGFAVAAIMIEPDVLFLDEVLAVGDVGFTIKCLNRVRELMSTSAVVLVSHSMPLVTSFCTRVLVMDHGRVMMDTDRPGEAVEHYFGLIKSKEQISGNGGLRVLEAVILVDGDELPDGSATVAQGAEAVVSLRVQVGDSHLAQLSVYIDDATHAQVLVVPVNDAEGSPIILSAGAHHLHVPLGVMEMNAGKYSVLVAAKDPRYESALCRHQGLSPFTVTAGRTYWSKFVRRSASHVITEHWDGG